MRTGIAMSPVCLSHPRPQALGSSGPLLGGQATLRCSAVAMLGRPGLACFCCPCPQACPTGHRRHSARPSMPPRHLPECAASSGSRSPWGLLGNLCRFSVTLQISVILPQTLLPKVAPPSPEKAGPPEVLLRLHICQSPWDKLLMGSSEGRAVHTSRCFLRKHQTCLRLPSSKIRPSWLLPERFWMLEIPPFLPPRSEIFLQWILLV